jgi:hypothetical protein
MHAPPDRLPTPFDHVSGCTRLSVGEARQAPGPGAFPSSTERRGLPVLFAPAEAGG